MESKAIFDAQISASSQVDDNLSAAQARLHSKADGSKGGGWSALVSDVDQWLQVDFGSYTIVTRVATQGRNAYNEWVTKYSLQYSDDGFIFRFYKGAAVNSSARVWRSLKTHLCSPVDKIVKSRCTNNVVNNTTVKCTVKGLI